MTRIWLQKIKSDNANWLRRYLHEEEPEKSFKSKWNWTDLIFEKSITFLLCLAGWINCFMFLREESLWDNGLQLLGKELSSTGLEKRIAAKDFIATAITVLKQQRTVLAFWKGLRIMKGGPFFIPTEDRTRKWFSWWWGI